MLKCDIKPQRQAGGGRGGGDRVWKPRDLIQAAQDSLSINSPAKIKCGFLSFVYTWDGFFMGDLASTAVTVTPPVLLGVFKVSDHPTAVISSSSPAWGQALSQWKHFIRLETWVMILCFLSQSQLVLRIVIQLSLHHKRCACQLILPKTH